MRQCCADTLNKPSVSSLPSLYAWYVSMQQQQQALSASRRRRGASNNIRRWCASLRDPVGASSNSDTELLPGRNQRRISASHKRPREADSRTQSHSNLDPTLEQAVLAGNGVRAHQLFQELHRLEPQCFPEAQLCDRLLQLLSQQSDFDKAWEIYDTVKTVPLRYSTLAAVMNTAIRAGDLNKAQQVFRSMQQRGYKPNITTWCHLISSFNRSRKGPRKGWPFRETAYSLWKELTSQKDALKDLDASAFATGMMACCGFGKVEEARSLLADMRTAGYPPDIRIFNILLRGYAQTGGVDVISGLLESIRAEGLKPSATTYNTLIDAYVNHGMLQKAQEVLQEAKGSSARIDAWAYSSLLKGYVRAGMLQEATELVQHMEASQILPNVVTLTTLLDGCVRAGKMEDAEEVMSRMRRRRIPANVVTYNTLLRGYAQTGNLEAVRDVLHRMGEDGIHPREDTFNTLMEGALQNNDPQLVPQLFRQLVNLQLRPDSLSYTALITALARLSQPESALRAYGQLEEAGAICAISLNALVAALANANRIPEAEEHLQQATQLAARQGQPPPIEAYGAVLKAYARLKDGEAAMDLFQEFQRLGGEPDDRLVDVAVTACIRAQQYKRALQFVRAMERRGKNVDKARLKQALEVVIRSQSNALRRRSGLLPARNENLERLKFWIGVPNRYYGSDSEQ